MNKNLNAQLSSNTDNWSTPKDLYDKLNDKFHFDYDPCPLNSDDKTTLINGDWKGNIFINPPYSNVKEFLNKGLMELKKGNAKLLVYLIIPRTSTKYWRDYVMRYADAIYFIPKKLKFGNSKSSAPFPSCIVVFREICPKNMIPCYVWK